MTDDRYTVAMTVHREDGTPISIIELAGHQPRLLINAAAVATDTALKAHPATGDLPDEVEVRSLSGNAIKIPGDLKDKVHFIDGPIDFNEVAMSGHKYHPGGPVTTVEDGTDVLPCGCTEAQAATTRTIATDITDPGRRCAVCVAHASEGGQVHIEATEHGIAPDSALVLDPKLPHDTIQSRVRRWLGQERDR